VELPSLKLDSQAKYGALSRGDASIFMRFPDAAYREKIWDHCAGVAIIEV
jgi:3'(2'), 5'-bisphosphate nucleotidase/inositol polyphosphate 1-phosphatase